MLIGSCLTPDLWNDEVFRAERIGGVGGCLFYVCRIGEECLLETGEFRYYANAVINTIPTV